MPDAIVCVISNPNTNELGFKERRVGSVAILDVDAQLRIKLRFGGSSVALADAAASLVAAGQTHILINLDGVSSLGAKSMGELVSAFVAVRDSGGELKLFNLAPAIRELMQATNLFAVFGLYETEAQAIESFSVSAMRSSNN
jgi:anti-sigma B factor antagonist